MHAQILVHYGSCRNSTQALGNVRTFSPHPPHDMTCEHELKLIENVLQAPPLKNCG